MLLSKLLNIFKGLEFEKKFEKPTIGKVEKAESTKTYENFKVFDKVSSGKYFFW